jgi:hypothetical protein
MIIKRLALIACLPVLAACGTTSTTKDAAPVVATSLATTTVAPTTAAAPTTTAAVPTASVALVLDPFTDKGPAPGIHVVLKRTGTCQTSNVDFGNAQAYRCFLDVNEPDGDGIEDPCFEDPIDTAQPLLCLDDPDGKHTVAVTSRKELDSNDPPPDSDPWFVQLADGTMCSGMGGATFTLQGLRANYGCVGGGTLFGDPDTSAPVWTMLYQPKGSTSAAHVAVSKTWT